MKFLSFSAAFRSYRPDTSRSDIKGSESRFRMGPILIACMILAGCSGAGQADTSVGTAGATSYVAQLMPTAATFQSDGAPNIPSTGDGATSGSGVADAGAAGVGAAIPLPDGLSINGKSVQAQLVDTLTTRSGDWALYDLGPVEDSRAYMWKLAQSPDFVRVMVCRRHFTKEAGDTTALSMQTVDVGVPGKSGVYAWTLKVAQGSCRVMQNQEPVRPNPTWLREAVATNRVPAYRRERAWLPANLRALSKDPQRGGTYDPTSLGPVPGRPADTPTANINYVGVTSRQGGEYPASRGFLHDIDARLIDAALHNEDARIADVWSQVTQYSWYSLSQPQGAVWSLDRHVLVDPQFPQAGERGWETPTWASPYNYIDTMTTVDNWDRDPSHLENTGFVHWLLTEDPVAGLVVQRQAAYSLGSFYENFRVKNDTTYKGFMSQERGVYNTLSTLWKSKDVADRVRSQTGKVLWDSARTAKQSRDVFDNYDAQLFAKAQQAAPTSVRDYARKLVSASMAIADSDIFNVADGTQQELFLISNFQLQQYAKEPMYLWAKAGDPVIRKWFAEAARHLDVRITLIGGRAGVDGCASIRGSSLPIAPKTTGVPFSDLAGWADWVNTYVCPTVVRTSYDGAALHTLMQMEGLLLLARDAGVYATDSALARLAADRSRTTTLRYTDLQMYKHLAAPN